MRNLTLAAIKMSPDYMYDYMRGSLTPSGNSFPQRVLEYFVTHDEERFTEFISSDWQPCFFSGNPKPLFKGENIASCFTQQNTPGFLEYFSSLARSAILKAEKALGKRLRFFFDRTHSPFSRPQSRLALFTVGD